MLTLRNSIVSLSIAIFIGGCSAYENHGYVWAYDSARSYASLPLSLSSLVPRREPGWLL